MKPEFARKALSKQKQSKKAKSKHLNSKKKVLSKHYKSKKQSTFKAESKQKQSTNMKNLSCGEIVLISC
ncbi:hypothetical protein E4148_004975 [Escherichia coli]|nr:hypothetical protein [Escherichia coli]